LFQLPGFEAEVTFGAEPVENTDRKILTARLWRAVSEQFGSVTLEGACGAPTHSLRTT
jgi:hypothetical protein